MNIQQLEYIVAIDKHRHFVKAAEQCFVTQPTLSMMVKKLEEELGVVIFHRHKGAPEPTPEGKELIKRAKEVLAGCRQIEDYARSLKTEITGEFRLGIIPTLAPYLLPLFLKPFVQKYGGLHLHLKELTTQSIIRALLDDNLDAAILATPLQEPRLTEYRLFNEEFIAYVSNSVKIPKSTPLAASKLKDQQIWFLEDGHCFRHQVLSFCDLRKALPEQALVYEAGSIASLINLTDSYGGITIIPQLAEATLNAAQRQNIRTFATPKPVREISLVVREGFPRHNFLKNFSKLIVDALPFKPEKPQQKIIEVR